jgi:hypothetical protein
MPLHKRMITLMHVFSRNFPIIPVKGFSKVFIIFIFPFFFLVDALAFPKEDTLNQSIALPSESPYMNYAKTGSYENEPWFADIPQWHYYDMFGNKLLDGYYLYGLSKNRNTIGTGTDNIALHPILKKILNGLVEVADVHDSGGILAMVGDRIKSEFTPFSLKQSLFVGTRLDAFYKQNSVSFLTNRISNTGFYGMYTNEARPTPDADWLTGAHGVRKIGELADIGGTFVNIHHEESRLLSNPFSGVDSDPLAKKTPAGLSLYGLDLNVKLNKLQAYCEYLRSQEFLDGDFLPKPGDVAMLNGHYNISDRWKCGGEFYTVGSRFQTNFTCPAHPLGDQNYGMGKYQYSLVEDNDDKDQYPENGQSRYPYYSWTSQLGDIDGTIPFKYDKDKNGLWDYEEDFLNYDADPPASKILFDKNNNGIPDELEDDAYPDYPYVPSYYLPGEKYYRFDDIDNKWEYKAADSFDLVHKGLAGLRLNSRYDILPDLEVTVGGIFERSQEKTFQMTYGNGVPIGEMFDFERSTSLYFLAHYKKNIALDKYFVIDDFCRKIQDNIPNHTQGFYRDRTEDTVTYHTIVDKLDYRDAFINALRAEFGIFRNRGLNFTTAGKYEFKKDFPHLEFNYADKNISSMILVNKCEYIYLLPFFKDMFLIPKFKNVWEIKDNGPNIGDTIDTHFRRDNLDDNYRTNTMANTAYLVCDWKLTERTAITTGLQIKKFNDFLDNGENYWEPCFSIQLRIKDCYRSVAVVLTTGFSRYAYIYDHPGRLHNPLSNAHRVVDNIDAHEIFIKAYCGFM